MGKLKLIWDFRGPDGCKIAEHHEIHLKQFIKSNSISVFKTGVETINELHSIAFMVVDEANMKPIRDALKPHRGQVFAE
jgi:hypothetical protein